MQAIHDRIVIRPVIEQTETSGGIQLAVPEDSAFMLGEVVSVGTGKLLDDGKIMPLSVEVGQHVLISKNAGSEFQNIEGIFRTIRDEEIIAIIEGD